MNKGTGFGLGLIVLLFNIPSVTFAYCANCHHDIEPAIPTPAGDMASYTAYRPKLLPTPTIFLPWPQGVYFSVKAGTSGSAGFTVTDISQPPTGATLVANTNSQTSGAPWGGSIGYLFRESGAFDRVEIEYLQRPKFSYQSTPIFVGTDSSINATVNSQTLLAKTTFSFDIGRIIFPYALIGAGAAMGKSSLTASVTNAGITVNTNSSTSKASFAWAVGGGLRVRLTPKIMTDLGYEYASLGSAPNFVISTAVGAPVTLGVNNIRTNTFLFSLIWQPWGEKFED